MNKALFILTLIMGTIMSISSNTWFGIWMGLEINLLSIIPLMSKPNSPISAESSIKYFITQALASSVLLASIISMKMMSNLTTNIMIESVMLTKMGAAPFHFWFPEVMEGLTWNINMIIMTWQKLAPMVILLYSPLIMKFTLIVIITSMLVSGLMGINQTSLRKIMAFSSINHIGWMLSTIQFMETLWLIYFLTYTVIIIPIVLIMSKLNLSHIKQFMNVMDKSPSKMFLSLNFLSLGGIPPFLGFFPKWLAIQGLIENKLIILAFLMVTLTLVPLYFYIRLSLTSLTLYQQKINQESPMLHSKMIFSMNSMSMIGLLICTVLFNLT
uniref:NADH-ubiquinone oxidoreductase chain 2 n=1 Tax=Histeridae sp. BMNH 1274741 TaxID=1796509 RepID=A0A126TGH9_9COLE|nr:NADH dehydrogenase subunit 2 [Histeridae sp. BMNH 1274741]